MNTEEMLKNDVYDLWNLYETIRNNVEMRMNTIYNNLDTKTDFVVSSYNTASTSIDLIISRLKRAAFTKIGILLGMGYVPNKDSVGREFVLYQIYI